MTYPIIPELYGIVARKLLDEIGEKSFYGKSSVSCPLKPSDSAPLC